jgi:hypothetical protein
MRGAFAKAKPPTASADTRVNPLTERSRPVRPADMRTVSVFDQSSTGASDVFTGTITDFVHR